MVVLCYRSLKDLRLQNNCGSILIVRHSYTLLQVHLWKTNGHTELPRDHFLYSVCQKPPPT